jgi:3-oxoacyl-[acyl-carrier-protein] synthase-1
MNIVAAGCLFPSGPGMPLASCALRAMLPLNTFHPYCVDQTGNRIKVSWFHDPTTFGIDRWLELARGALVDLYAQLPDPLPAALREGAGSLWLALPDAARPGVPAQLADSIVASLPKEPLNFGSYRSSQGGHATAVDLIQEIVQAKPSPSSFAVVLAVDSWLPPDSLQWLDAQGLLQGAGRPANREVWRSPYGRIPSEGAAAVLLGGSDSGWCPILGVGIADELILRTDTRPCTGQGLTQAAQQALKGLAPEQRIRRVVVDLNGEPYRADQFGFTALRVASHLADGWKQQTPALVTGDVGCATALVHIALTAYELAHHKDDPDYGPRLLLSSSDDALRGAVVLGSA